MRRWLPWYGKIAAKLVLSRLPVPYHAWKKFDLFAHGHMQDPGYACGVFRQHYERSGFAHKGDGFVALEIGPGDSLLSAVIAKAHGARASYLVDTGAYAMDDPAPYVATADHLRSLGLAPPDLDGASTLDDILTACDATYLTAGLNSLRGIPAASVDFVWSQAVLEHIRRREFPDFMRELRRVLSAEGVCSHRIDLMDHLGGALNNLRVPMRWWEADWMARSGFYTNRIRFAEMIGMFEAAGFNVNVVGVTRWERLPTPRYRMTAEFRDCPEDELLVNGFDVLLSPA